MRALRTVALLLLVAAVLVLPGCVYAHIKTPLDTDLDATSLPSDTKVGESHFTSLLWLVAWGDAGTQAAATDGGITTINHADEEILSILGGLYFRNTTIVYGN